MPHWSAAWVGLDVMEAIGLAVTGWLVRRGDPRRCLAAAATAMLLVVDAWFDISTAGSGLTEAVAMATCAELPMAALCSVVAYRAVRDSSRPPRLDNSRADQVAIKAVRSRSRSSDTAEMTCNKRRPVTWDAW